MKSRLNQYLEIGKNPTLATLRQLEEIKATADEMSKREIQKAIKLIIENYKKTRGKIMEGAAIILQDLKKRSENGADEILRDFRAKYPDFHDIVVSELKAHTLAHPELFKGEKGDSIRGDAGKAPTAKELKKLIETYGKGQDGKTPVPELDYPSERQVKLMVKELGKKIEERQAKAMKKMMPKVKIPTVEQLVRAIEALPEKKKLDYYRGLKNQPSNTDTQVGGGLARGGGMGNVVPYTVAINSGTTTITLPSRVASNGMAIWFSYQGQQQAYGTHFTVSGNTITLLFTPSDDTFADLIYIRT